MKVIEHCVAWSPVKLGFCPYYKSEDTEAPKGQVSCQWSHNKQVGIGVRIQTQVGLTPKLGTLPESGSC